MKQDIHPTYEAITATCSCGNVINVGSTVAKDLALDVCSACHRSTLVSKKLLTLVDVLISSNLVLVHLSLRNNFSLTLVKKSTLGCFFYA